MSEAIAVESPPLILVPAAHAEANHDGHARLSKGAVVLAVARRGLPHIAEATLVPAILFFVIVTTVGAAIAMATVLVWGYGAILRRVLRGARIPTVLLLATLGLTVKTLVGLLSGSTFAYFLQPVATTVVVAGVLVGSLLIGRPLVARFAHDFCPVAPDVASRPAVVRLFIGLTVLWAGAQLLTAAVTFGMLVTLSVPMFVALKTVVYVAISITAIVITVFWALRTARTEQLTFAAA
jgi:hypothetical protein